MTTKTDRNLPSKSSLPNNLNTPQQKRRISIHKLLINTMHGRRHHRHKETKDSTPIQEKQSNRKRKNNKWTKSKIHFPMTVGSILHNVFGHKKSKDICSPSIEDEERRSNRSHSLKEILETEKDEDEGKQEEFDDRKRLKSLKISLSFSGFFSKKVVLNFRKCKSNNRSNSDQIGSQFLMGNQEYGRKFDRNPSGYRKIRRERSHKKGSEQSEEKESEQERGGGEGELWKKRILKGAKCRPVQLSGDLQIGRNGALLP